DARRRRALRRDRSERCSRVERAAERVPDQHRGAARRRSARAMVRARRTRGGAMIALSSKRVARGLRAACLAELRVAKPGNVSTASPGHGMSARDFVASARVAAPALAAAAGGVGERVLRAVEATRAVVGCNTNLGIVLLCAPLAHAALVPAPERALRPRLEAVLEA